jgi:hypothetical protein
MSVQNFLYNCKISLEHELTHLYQYIIHLAIKFYGKLHEVSNNQIGDPIEYSLRKEEFDPLIKTSIGFFRSFLGEPFNINNKKHLRDLDYFIKNYHFFEDLLKENTKLYNLALKKFFELLMKNDNTDPDFLLLEKRQEEMEKAVKSGNEKIVKNLLDKGIVIKDRMLNQAAKNGNIEIVKLLLNAGADPNQPYALSWAAQKGFFDIVNLILKYNPNKSTINEALKLAQKYKHDDIFNILKGEI